MNESIEKTELNIEESQMNTDASAPSKKDNIPKNNQKKKKNNTDGPSNPSNPNNPNNDSGVEQINQNSSESDKLDLYYKLKSNYEMNTKTLNDIILKERKQKENSPKKDIPREESPNTNNNDNNIRKQKCLFCKRPVTSIFQTKYNSENKSRLLTAKCGDTVKPCNFNIEIQLNPVQLLNNMVNEQRDFLTEKQIDIIKTKNDLLFGYIDEGSAIQKFEQLQKEIEDETLLLEQTITKLLNITRNRERNQLIKEDTEALYLNIDTFKTHIKEYIRTKNKQHIQNANLFYKHELLPSIDKIIANKYITRMMLKDTKSLTEDTFIDDKYTLEQRGFITDMLEDSSDKNIIEIIHFIVGNSMSGGGNIKNSTIRRRILKFNRSLKQRAT